MQRDREAGGRENGLPHDAHDIPKREKIEGARERVKTQRSMLGGGSSESRRTTVGRSQTPHMHRSRGWPRQLLPLA